LIDCIGYNFAREREKILKEENWKQLQMIRKSLGGLGPEAVFFIRTGRGRLMEHNDDSQNGGLNTLLSLSINVMMVLGKRPPVITDDRHIIRALLS